MCVYDLFTYKNGAAVQTDGLLTYQLNLFSHTLADLPIAALQKISTMHVLIY